MGKFRALVVTKSDDKQSADWTELDDSELMEGDVTVRVTHSTLNYKDGLAITGAAPIIDSYPMIPGIDLAGVVEESSSTEFKPGDQVLVNGCGIGERHFGGYAERARVKSEWVVPVPDGWSCAEAMAVGTAGYTAMLCVLGLLDHDLKPDRGPVVVTGASGGVGSVAIALLAKYGFHVVASTGRTEEEDYLKSIGAAEIINREELQGKVRPLDKMRWAGGVDAIGSTTLANVLSQTQFYGVVTCCGIAGGRDLPASVLPFILRGVTLQGCESIFTPRPLRLRAWQQLGKDMDRDILKAMSQTYPVEKVIEMAPEILAGKVRGRTVYEIG